MRDLTELRRPQHRETSHSNHSMERLPCGCFGRPQRIVIHEEIRLPPNHQGPKSTQNASKRTRDQIVPAMPFIPLCAAETPAYG